MTTARIIADRLEELALDILSEAAYVMDYEGSTGTCISKHVLSYVDMQDVIEHALKHDLNPNDLFTCIMITVGK